MFASDRAGRAVAKGVAISVLLHTAFAWVLAEYVSVGSVEPFELQVRALSDEVPEITGEFADPTDGHVGRTIARSNGTARRPGERAGRRGREAEGNAGRDDTSDGPTNATDDSGPPEPASRAETELRRALAPESPDEPESQPPPPDPLAETTVASSEQPSPPKTESPDDRERREDETEEPDSESAESEPDDALPSGAEPSFPSIEGEGTEGSGDEGDGEGAGTRGGVSLALIEQVIRAHHDEIVKCYVTRHDYGANGRQTVVSEFWIGRDGLPTRTRTVHRTTNPSVAKCINDRIEEWKFPKLDETVSFVKTFTFDPKIEAKWVHPGHPSAPDEPVK